MVNFLGPLYTLNVQQAIWARGVDIALTLTPWRNIPLKIEGVFEI